MSDEKILAVPEPAAWTPLTFDPQLCTGCNLCVEVCQVDIMMPNPEEGQVPIVLYPGECWYSGDCVDACPCPGAVKLNVHAVNSVHWKRKDTGESFFL